MCFQVLLFGQHGAGGGMEEAARARVRCAWAKFKELSSILTVCGASYYINPFATRHAYMRQLFHCLQ